MIMKFFFQKIGFYAGYGIAWLCWKWDAPLPHRNLLPFFLSVLNLSGAGAEIGAGGGYFSFIVLSRSRLQKMYSIDSWEGDCAKREPIARQKLFPFGNRSVVIRASSLAATPLVDDDSLDFLYIDADHRYESVAADLAAWWPKLKKGGLFSGHDYVDGDFFEGKFGVKKAVDKFLSNHAHSDFHAVPSKWPTWYCIKR